MILGKRVTNPHLASYGAYCPLCEKWIEAFTTYVVKLTDPDDLRGTTRARTQGPGRWVHESCAIEHERSAVTDKDDDAIQGVLFDD